MTFEKRQLRSSSDLYMCQNYAQTHVHTYKNIEGKGMERENYQMSFKDWEPFFNFNISFLTIFIDETYFEKK